MIKDVKSVSTTSKENEVNLAVIVLTFNEAQNITDCLESVCNWAHQIFIVDSYSTDETLTIAKRYTDLVFQNPWISFARQREWAINNLRIESDWVLFLDADERMTPECEREISALLKTPNNFQGYYIRRKYYFMGKWLKHGGYYPLKELRLLNWKHTQFIDESGGAREKFLVGGKTGSLKTDIIHIYDKGITNWIDKHIRLAKLEAESLVIENTNDFIVGKTSWVRKHLYNHLPRLLKPFASFIYRYFLMLGFLDGQIGFIFCFLHGFWYPFITELYVKEKIIANNNKNGT